MPDRSYVLSRPKLSDLFVLTFCLSVFLAGCGYAYGSDYNFVLWQLNDLELFGYGVGVACCWTGVFRLLRPEAGHGPLPLSEWQPGEVICLVEGTYYLIVAIMGGAFRYWLLGGAAESPDDPPIDDRLLTLLYALPPAVLCLGYLWLAKRVTIAAWRRGAIAKLISHAATPVLLFLLISLSYSEYDTTTISIGVSLLLLACVAIPTGMILAAAWTDRRLVGVHWTHWLGVFAFTVIHASRFSLEVRASADFIAP